jgi:hypothetical protein
MEVDVVTSPGVNAKTVRARMGIHRNGQAPKTETEVEKRIQDVMRERMARVLRLFWIKKVRNIVLDSLGTGVFGYVLSF